ncbi:Asp-tRNAAsn/Glu-tRNAGln amidotransferase A subunit [Mucilaginibacter sp. OK268]|uniref:amidase n=1 Tax=Mucilaginibacter sp. OK268 TaxID=1881048 RepID=UPI0008923888|nr:amidase [Mucilaginibacter sp. OK268]SDP91192.1 Asp-tRNAAsn/Glu-tRNAGln amidotransferase A subunit [Mucilaginibacter sp. OK268]
MENYHNASIAAVSKLIKAKKVSPVDLVDACLQRIEEYDTQLNTFITVLADEARKQAQITEEEINRGEWKGPLHGIPVAVKDFYDTAGIRTTAGFVHFKDRIPEKDAEVVQKLKEAGAILIGKTNMHELGMGTTSLVSYFGPVHNPWNTEFIAGGSSGGSAAAVAAGFCYATIDTDAVGSCRLPAACCGVTGFKSTYGLISGKGILEGEQADETIIKLSHVGITTRYAEDAAILLDIFSDQQQATDLSDHKKITIGFVSNYKASDGVNAVYFQAKEKFSSLGYRIADISLPFELASFSTATIDQDRKTISEQLFKNVDVVVLPTLTGQVPDIQSAQAKGPMTLSADNTFFFNYYGLPAISIPCGFDGNGMPQGLQVAGPWGGDDQVLKVAHVYEQAAQWNEKHPLL